MIFHSLFETSKSYLQPALIATTAGAGVLLSSSVGTRAPEAAIAVAPAYLFLALFAGLAQLLDPSYTAELSLEADGRWQRQAKPSTHV